MSYLMFRRVLEVRDSYLKLLRIWEALRPVVAYLSLLEQQFL